MKKLVILLWCLLWCLSSVFAQTTYRTTNTNIFYIGQWTKIASVTIQNRYQYSNSVIQLSGGGSSGYVGVCKLYFRVKQQAEFSNAPFIQLELSERNNARISKDDIKAVIVDLSGSGNTGYSTVDLFIRVTNGYEIIEFTPLMVNNVNPTFYANQPFDTSSPEGAQVDCSYIDDYSRNGFFEGKVGIGVTTVTEALEVNGNIRSREVKVEAAPWPDYVFSEDYPLLSLEHTENFIRENGRLPDIPSANEVAENGIPLGEMNANLLKKIEELTLYLIEQNKTIMAQESQMQVFKEDIKLLKASIRDLQSR